MTDFLLLIQAYMGTGLVVFLYLCCALCLFLWEDKKECRCLFLYVPFLVLLGVYNPISSRILTRYLGDEIGYRFLWLLPISITVAYTIISACMKLKGVQKRLLFLLCSIAVIAGCGSLFYLNPNVTRAENRYHMPAGVVELCDELVIPGREIMVAFPAEMVQYVRQYTALICMPYGRENLVDSWENQYNELAQCMKQEHIDGNYLAALCDFYVCHYVVLPVEKAQALAAPIPEERYTYYKEVDGYVIYRSTTANFDMSW